MKNHFYALGFEEETKSTIFYSCVEYIYYSRKYNLGKLKTMYRTKHAQHYNANIPPQVGVYMLYVPSLVQM